LIEEVSPSDSATASAAFSPAFGPKNFPEHSEYPRLKERVSFHLLLKIAQRSAADENSFGFDEMNRAGFDEAEDLALAQS
jgi:hypothetical protein